MVVGVCFHTTEILYMKMGGGVSSFQTFALVDVMKFIVNTGAI